MMSSGRSSRAKGVRGEHDSAAIFTAHGGLVTMVQNNIDETVDYFVVFPTVYDDDDSGILRDEIKIAADSALRKRIDIRAKSVGIEAAVNGSVIPCVPYRHTMPPGQRAQPWRVSLRLEDFARLLGS